jgi:hypothetical protein
MPVTILHLSDLHRDSGSRLSTTALLDSLRRDRTRYTTDEKIARPDIAVVSGDVVYGVGPSEAGGEAKLARQYDEAFEFLVALAEEFFGGDRERVVIVPGNHDVSLPHVELSTEIIALPDLPEQRALLSQRLGFDGSQLRWSMSDLTMRRIKDAEIYNRRFEPFARFYDKFYGTGRSFSLEPGDQISIHDFPTFGIVIAGLSSCYENDLYNRTGRIYPDCVASASRRVAELTRRGRLALAVWHHSLQGGPRDVDYLDADVLQSLMDGDFVLAMHGHQHRPQVLEHRFTADRTRGMVVVSAGTLCGGPRSLPSGRMRAYNILTLDPYAKNGVIHVREMKNTDFSLPVWGPAFVAEFSGSSLPFAFTSPARAASAFEDASEAAELLRGGNAVEAYSLVRRHLSDPLARRVAVQALGELRDWNEVVRVINPPTSADEFVILADAFDELNLVTDLSALLSSNFAVTSSDPGVQMCIAIKRHQVER